MKRLTATVLFVTALSASAAMAESPTVREMNSWDHVQQVAYPPQMQQEAPMMEHRDMQRPYHHDRMNHHDGMKHHHHGMKHHDGKHHDGAKHHHHHHHKDAAKDAAPAKDQPKQ